MARFSAYALFLLASVQLAVAHRRGHARNLARHRAIVTRFVTVDAPNAIVYVDGDGIPYKTEMVQDMSTTMLASPISDKSSVMSLTSTTQPLFTNLLPSALEVIGTISGNNTASSQPDMVIVTEIVNVIPYPATMPQPSHTLQSTSNTSTVSLPSAGIANIASSSPQLDFASIDSKSISTTGIAKNSSIYGVSWTPFDGVEGYTTCKSQMQANAEFRKIALNNFTSVRIYGTACSQVELAINAAIPTNLTLMLGVFDIKNTVDEINDLIQQVKSAGSNWNIIHTVSVGNEDVQKGVTTPEEVMYAVIMARKQLVQTSFQGNIVHVDTAGAFLKYPQLCGDRAGDYIAANVHPFFSAGVPASQAGSFVANQVDLLRQCSHQNSKKRIDHRVVIAETGWPSNGAPNGQARPGPAEQLAAIASITQRVPNDLFLYSAFNNKWLVNNAGTFNAEHYWGILDG